MRIQFLSDQVYEQGGRGKGPRFEKGLVLDSGQVQEALGLGQRPSDAWVEGFMNRWVQRGSAKVVDDSTPTGLVVQESEQSGGGAGDEVDIEKLTRAELDALADLRGVDISTARNKGDVIDLLKAAEKA